MNNKNVLITGANKSIGFETARELVYWDIRSGWVAVTTIGVNQPWTA